MQAHNTLKDLNKRVILLADRGFADTDLMRLCRRLKWGFPIRIKGTFQVHRPGKAVRQIADLCPATPNKAVFLHNVRITQERYGLIHLALACDKESGEFWYIASDSLTGMQTFEEYGLRFDTCAEPVEALKRTFWMTSPTVSNSKVPAFARRRDLNASVSLRR